MRNFLLGIGTTHTSGAPDEPDLTVGVPLSVPAVTVGVMATFALTLVHGPGWDPARPIRKQDAWDAHAAFMDGLVDDGFIAVGGPLGTGERTLHLVQADDEEQVRARLAGDPWAAADLLRIGSIEPWALWLDGRR
jgi:hypothetical protein